MRRTILAVCFAFAATGLAAQTQIPESRAEISLSFAPVVEKAAPSVVNIYAERVVRQRVSPFANDPFFRDFFGQFDRAVPRVQNSLGSGVIVSSEGLIVTNAHVVAGAVEIRAVLPDRREFAGSIVMADEGADIAVIQLEGARGLPAVRFGNPDALSVGDLVLAIGNPFGVGQTVTSGIVSGLARSGGSIANPDGYFIQTDASINPGNSGGALVNMAGELIGLPTSIITRSGGANGIGFAIPANLVAQYAAQAADGETRFSRPWAGLRAQTVGADIAEALGQEIPRGILITELHSESPFRAAGLLRGDVLTSFEGQPVNRPAELEFRMSVRGFGGKAKVVFLRSGDPVETEVAMTGPPRASREAPITVQGQGRFAGVEVQTLGPGIIDRYDLPLAAQGVVVARVPRSMNHLAPGDLLLSINGEPVGSATEAARRLSGMARVWVLEVQRGNQRIRMQLRGNRG